MMRIITVLVILTLTGCSVSKLVKKTNPVEIKNDNVQLAIPLIDPKPDKSNTIITNLSRPQKIQATNDVATRVGIIVLIICFLPVIVLYVNWCVSSLFKLYRTLKTRSETK